MANPNFRVAEYTASDGYCWKYRDYPAVGTQRGRVVCIHGIQSHGGWYEHSCARLQQAGYQTCFLDRRGAGLNEQARGDTPGFRRLLDDLAEFLQRLRAEPGPLFLLAISWGGKLAAALQRRHPGLVDGLVLICPGFCPQVRLPFFQRMRIFFSRLVVPRRLFPIPLSEPELFTATPHWQQFLRTDPLALHQATARFMIENVRLDGYLYVVPPHVKSPLLLLLAGKDRIIDNARTRRYVERFATTDRTVLEYPDAHHTLEFEPDPEPYIADVLQWLDKRSHAPG